MNTFRVQHGDSRAKSEEELGALIEQMGTKWWEEVQGVFEGCEDCADGFLGGGVEEGEEVEGEFMVEQE